MKKLIASISIITALGVGAFALNSVLPAGAVGSVTTQSTDPSSGCGTRGAKFKGVLDKLVGDATITQAQEDAIIQATKDELAGSQSGPAGRGGARRKVLEGMAKVAADTIGVSVADLKTADAAGQSVADVATAHSVKPSDVVTAIVNAGTTKLSQAVTSGLLTQAQADKLTSRLPDAADKFVNNTKPQGC